MSTGYLAEVDTVNGTKYISKQSHLSKVPFFWHSAGALKRAMNPRYTYGSRFDRKTMLEKTAIVIAKDLHKGLRASSASRHTAYQFESMNFSKISPKAPRNAVFKIEVLPTKKSPRPTKTYAGPGRLGKTWLRQGDVRLHISANLDRLNGYYIGAQVVIIELDDDGITPKSITRKPIIDWYRLSQSCDIRFRNFFRESISNFTPVPDRAL